MVQRSTKACRLLSKKPEIHCPPVQNNPGRGQAQEVARMARFRGGRPGLPSHPVSQQDSLSLERSFFGASQRILEFGLGCARTHGDGRPKGRENSSRDLTS